MNTFLLSVFSWQFTHKDVRMDSRRRVKRWWVRLWILRRSQFGQYERLVYEMKTEDVQAYVLFCCFDPDIFQELLTRIENCPLESQGGIPPSGHP